MKILKLLLIAAIVWVGIVSTSFAQPHKGKSDISHLTIGKGKGDGDLIGD
jgi:hypothetical protein